MTINWTIRTITHRLQMKPKKPTVSYVWDDVEGRVVPVTKLTFEVQEMDEATRESLALHAVNEKRLLVTIDEEQASMKMEGREGEGQTSVTLEGGGPSVQTNLAGLHEVAREAHGGVQAIDRQTGEILDGADRGMDAHEDAMDAEAYASEGEEQGPELEDYTRDDWPTGLDEESTSRLWETLNSVEEAIAGGSETQTDQTFSDEAETEAQSIAETIAAATTVDEHQAAKDAYDEFVARYWESGIDVSLLVWRKKRELSKAEG